MTLPPQITFRNMEATEADEALIRREIATLERFFPRIMSCRVAVEAPIRQSAHYKVRIDLSAPGKELVVKHSPSLHETLAGGAVAKRTKSGEIQRTRRMLGRAVKDAFAEMRRRLQDHVRRVRGAQKQHEPPPPARVTKLFPDADYGYLETHDGREIYFHRNAVLDGHFDHLRLGSEVHFAEEAGEQGPQASTVRLVHTGRQLRGAAKVVPLSAKRAPSAAKKKTRSRSA